MILLRLFQRPHLKVLAQNRHFQVKVFRNEHARTNDHAPLTINRMRMTIDTSTFSDSLSEENNFKTLAYSHLKNLTKSFRDDSKDV